MIVPRRRLLLSASAAMFAGMPRAGATTRQVADLIATIAAGATPKVGRIKLDVPVIVENGNTVAMTVSIPGRIAGPERLQSIYVFAEGNPLPNVAAFHFGPRAGAPRIATRIRLATSQTVIALAKYDDGSCWTDTVELLVTLAACIDGV